MTAETNIETSIAIVANPRSGKGAAVKTGQWLAEQLAVRNIPHEIYTDAWPQQFEGFTEVWIVGGDGTINYFLNAYRNIDLSLVIFKGGTGNDFSWKLYGDISVEEQFNLVLNAKPRYVDAISCNDKLYVNSLGIGFDGEVLQSIGTVRWLGGHLGYLWVVIKKIFSYKEPVFKITIGDKTFNERFLLVVVNNSTRTGGGFMVTPEASVDDGFGDMVLCKPLALLKRFRYLPVIEKGKHLQLSFIVFSKVQQVSIESEKEMSAALDGELIQGRSFEIKVIPGLLKFKY